MAALHDLPRQVSQEARRHQVPAPVLAGLTEAPRAGRAPVPAAVQPSHGGQAAEPGRLSVVVVTGPAAAVERHVVRCSVHGALSAHFRAIDARRASRCRWCEGRG